MNTLPGFREESDGFNEASLSFLEKVAQDLRERLIQNSHKLILLAYEQDKRSKKPFYRILSDKQRGEALTREQTDSIVKLANEGMPLFLQRHDPAFEEVQVGADFVNAVSCRLVEPKFIDPEAQQYTPKHNWPIGREMIIYMPVINSFDDSIIADSELPKPRGDDIFIKYTGPSGTDPDTLDTQVYAIGQRYCYVHQPIGDIDFEIDYIMHDPKEAAKKLRLNDLNLEKLVAFHTEMIDMQRWPIKTYWPGVNASAIK